MKLSIHVAALTLAAAFASMGAHAQIRIGQTAGYSGASASSVSETIAGAKLYLDSVNAQGGVNGQQIELVSLDDKFDPALAAENAKKLIADPKVMALFLNRGTPHSEAIMPLLKVFGDRPIIVKDFVKSQKHYWLDAYFIPSASDRQAVERTRDRGDRDARARRHVVQGRAPLGAAGRPRPGRRSGVECFELTGHGL